MNKPWLTSIGVGLHFFGLWGHRYFGSKRKYKTRSFRFLGMHFVITSYRKSTLR